jgi:hypothetical protein
MVAYPQDRSTRDWTFHINNARHRLESIANRHPSIVPKAFVSDEAAGSSAKDYWSYFDAALAAGIRNFEAVLHAEPAI